MHTALAKGLCDAESLSHLCAGNGILSYALDPAIIGQNDSDPQTIKLKYNCQVNRCMTAWFIGR
jgi:hypothetical protein